jgi:ribonuclease HII
MLANYHNKEGVEVGCDEAGRGCLAGPVVAAAVILPKKGILKELNDSKALSDKKRWELRKKMEEAGYAFGIGIVDEKEIDKINILNASFLAMHRAMDQLNEEFDRILVDGNRFNPYKEYEYHCMIKGDARFKSIAAASIFAKTERDKIMETFDLEYPQYDWKNNKGYPTKKHRQAIEEFGISPLHRQTFQLLNKQTKLPL